MLAGLARAGEPTPVYVPDTAKKTMRDLLRVREDLIVTLFVGTES